MGDVCLRKSKAQREPRHRCHTSGDKTLAGRAARSPARWWTGWLVSVWLARCCLASLASLAHWLAGRTLPGNDTAGAGNRESCVCVFFQHCRDLSSLCFPKDQSEICFQYPVCPLSHHGWIYSSSHSFLPSLRPSYLRRWCLYVSQHAYAVD